MPRVTAIEIVEDRTATSRCDEGFLRLKRYRARNRRADGSTSREYHIDVIDRPTLDAVALVIWARTPRGVEVLTRRGLRPAAYFRRDKAPPLPEPEYLLVEEIVAGVLEPGEAGVAALVRRAVEEAREEAGLRVDPAKVARLGAPFFLVPGIASEKIHMLEVEVDPHLMDWRAAGLPDEAAPARAAGAGGPGEPPQQAWFDAPEEGDGSPLEEGAELRWRELGAALRACEAGEIEDVKTELGLRRLADRLRG